MCLTALAPTVTVPIAANATPTFAIFVRGVGAVAFDPATARIFVRLTDAAGLVSGLTSVAVQTLPQ